jgi:hypothetical protein
MPGTTNPRRRKQNDTTLPHDQEHIYMNAIEEFKPVGQTILPDSRGRTPKLLFAIFQARKASLELSDKLYILENLLKEAGD